MTKEISFPESALKFLKDLGKNNSKEWFEENRERYQNELLNPAQIFVEIMGLRLREIVPGIHAIPKIDKSIFRLHRDVRFSKDKAPYKTNLGILFWEGNKKKMECPGFYFHLSPEEIFLGSGLYMFPDDTLKKYRKVVSSSKNANELNKISSEQEKHPGLKIMGKHYKNVPRGYDQEYEYAEYLKFNGLYSMLEINTEQILSEDIVEFCFDKFREMLPLHRWIMENLM